MTTNHLLLTLLTSSLTIAIGTIVPIHRTAHIPHHSQDSLPPGVARLLAAYPKHLKGYEDNHIIWHDGTRMPYDDGRIKTEDEAFDSTDLEDQMNGLVYTPGPMIDTPGYNCDPGTFRYQPFFLKMYGSTEAEVRRHLVPIVWPAPRRGRTQRIWVTSVNGVNHRLQAIANELAARPYLRKYVTNIGGVSNWRNIMGTTRQSAHSFGMALDINTQYSQYWKWDYKETWMIDSVEQHIQWRNTVPWEIVEIFERHGFIWGGKWYHYDTMHFKYRPELVTPAPLKPKKKAAMAPNRKKPVAKPAKRS